MRGRARCALAVADVSPRRVLQTADSFDLALNIPVEQECRMSQQVRSHVHRDRPQLTGRRCRRAAAGIETLLASRRLNELTESAVQRGTGVQTRVCRAEFDLRGVPFPGLPGVHCTVERRCQRGSDHWIGD